MRPLRLVTLCAVAVLCVTTSLRAQDSLLDRERNQALASRIPDSSDAALQQLKADALTRGILYDDAVLIPAVQDADSNRQGVHAKHGVFGRRHTIAHDFPWAIGAGMTRATNGSRFFGVLLPVDDAGRQAPIVYRIAPAIRPELRSRQDIRSTYQWFFPVGTRVFEVINAHDSAGRPHVFQVNVLERDAAGWEPNVWRRFADAAELADAIRDLRPDWQADAALSRLVAQLDSEQVPVRVVRETDTVHPLRPAFDDEAAIELLPPIGDEALAARLLDGPFTSVKDRLWRYSDPPVRAPTVDSGSGLHVVAEGFTGGLIAVSRESCARCHQDTGLHVSHFDTFNAPMGGLSVELPRTQERVLSQRSRHWYGLVPGSDMILSFHPFANEHVSGALDGGGFSIVNQQRSVESILRPSLVRAGLLERYDPDRHSNERYTVLVDSHVRR